jgi:hypothetical protein
MQGGAYLGPSPQRLPVAMARTGSKLRTRSLLRAVTAAAAMAIFGLLAMTGVAGTGSATGDPAPAAFRLDDGSAGCNFLGSGEIACRAVESPNALVLEPDGGVRSADVAVHWDESTPVLSAAESWWHGDVTCRVDGNRLACSTAEGGLIQVGADGEGGLVPPVTYTAP